MKNSLKLFLFSFIFINCYTITASQTEELKKTAIQEMLDQQAEARKKWQEYLKYREQLAQHCIDPLLPQDLQQKQTAPIYPFFIPLFYRVMENRKKAVEEYYIDTRTIKGKGTINYRMHKDNSEIGVTIPFFLDAAAFAQYGKPLEIFSSKLFGVKKRLHAEEFSLTTLDGLENIKNFEILERLLLKDNLIQAVPRNFFSHCPQLTELDLSDNLITTIPSGVFDSLTHLEILNLANNNLTALPDNVFEKTTKLRELKLSNNPFVEFPPELVESLKKLSVCFVSKPRSCYESPENKDSKRDSEKIIQWHEKMVKAVPAECSLCEIYMD